MYVTDEEALAIQEAQASAASKPRGPAPTHQRSPSTQTTEVIMPTLPPAHTLSFAGQDQSDLSLLKSTVPTLPSEEELEKLCSAPPLTYNEARATLPISAPPARHFCEICGYWGRAKCLNCGARICGLSCKTSHDEDRCQKYPG